MALASAKIEMTALPGPPGSDLVIRPFSVVLPASTCLKKHVLGELAAHIGFWRQSSFSKQVCCPDPRYLLRFSKGQDLASFRLAVSRGR